MGQPIELGGKRQRRLDSARVAMRVTGYEVEGVRRQMIFQVKKAFTDALIVVRYGRASVGHFFRMSAGMAGS
jgi:hypothetical protein